MIDYVFSVFFFFFFFFGKFLFFLNVFFVKD